ncbi:unnamed protein product [Caenorhabditis auriculariae]|uniref:Uncharacterized protein n=1 Tax=Caenorhabditis auriculariae TaxID=2777116 RepID=A0A8S1H6U4_9PELO|nr:unnamed protein product [Caenorhabditis auriculariae]
MTPKPKKVPRHQQATMSVRLRNLDSPQRRAIAEQQQQGREVRDRPATNNRGGAAANARRGAPANARGGAIAAPAQRRRSQRLAAARNPENVLDGGRPPAGVNRRPVGAANASGSGRGGHGNLVNRGGRGGAAAGQRRSSGRHRASAGRQHPVPEVEAVANIDADLPPPADVGDDVGRPEAQVVEKQTEPVPPTGQESLQMPLQRNEVSVQTEEVFREPEGAVRVVNVVANAPAFPPPRVIWLNRQRYVLDEEDWPNSASVRSPAPLVASVRSPAPLVASSQLCVRLPTHRLLCSAALHVSLRPPILPFSLRLIRAVRRSPQDRRRLLRRSTAREALLLTQTLDIRIDFTSRQRLRSFSSTPLVEPVAAPVVEPSPVPLSQHLHITHRVPPDEPQPMPDFTEFTSAERLYFPPMMNRVVQENDEVGAAAHEHITVGPRPTHALVPFLGELIIFFCFILLKKLPKNWQCIGRVFLNQSNRVPNRSPQHETLNEAYVETSNAAEEHGSSHDSNLPMAVLPSAGGADPSAEATSTHGNDGVGEENDNPAPAAGQEDRGNDDGREQN